MREASQTCAGSLADSRYLQASPWGISDLSYAHVVLLLFSLREGKGSGLWDDSNSWWLPSTRKSPPRILHVRYLPNHALSILDETKTVGNATSTREFLGTYKMSDIIPKTGPVDHHSSDFQLSFCAVAFPISIYIFFFFAGRYRRRKGMMDALLPNWLQ